MASCARSPCFSRSRARSASGTLLGSSRQRRARPRPAWCAARYRITLANRFPPWIQARGSSVRVPKPSPVPLRFHVSDHPGVAAGTGRGAGGAAGDDGCSSPAAPQRAGRGTLWATYRGAANAFHSILISLPLLAQLVWLLVMCDAFPLVIAQLKSSVARHSYRPRNSSCRRRSRSGVSKKL